MKIQDFLIPTVSQEENETIVTVRNVIDESFADFWEHHVNMIKARVHQLKKGIPVFRGAFICPKENIEGLEDEDYVMEVQLSIPSKLTNFVKMKELVCLGCHCMDNIMMCMYIRLHECALEEMFNNIGIVVNENYEQTN